MTATINEIMNQTERNFDNIIGFLQAMTQEQINEQPLPNKRSMGEIASHVILSHKIPYWFLWIIYKLAGAKARELDVPKYKWKLEKGKIRKSKFKDQEQLVRELQNLKQKTLGKLENLPARYHWTAHISTQHISTHIQQLQHLSYEMRPIG